VFRNSLILFSMSAVSATGVAWAHPNVTAETVRIEHVQITSAKTFAQVRAALEAQVPQLDPAIITALNAGDISGAEKLAHGAPLFIFLKRNHGALLRAQGGARNTIQYDIGNPLTASRITKHELAAALYAPIRVVLYENSKGTATFEYDRPSTLFGQFGDAAVDRVAHDLDQELEQALRRAAD
jgi:uncharacterized protein (DUF302 family)